MARAKLLLASTSERIVLGVFGKPGVGKSTFTEYLSRNISPQLMSVVSMDGFHLSNQVLSELGLSERKGAPDTFDVSGFLSLLHRIKSADNGPIYFPVFDRNVEESIAAQGVISPGAQLVVVEGNYLCHDKDGWEKISPILDESWCLEIDEDVRLSRLIARHIAFGKTPELAEMWAKGTDGRNAHLIGESAEKADYTIILD